MSQLISIDLAQINHFAGLRKHGGHNKVREKKATEMLGFKASQEERALIDQALTLMNSDVHITRSTFLAAITVTACEEILKLHGHSREI